MALGYTLRNWYNAEKHELFLITFLFPSYHKMMVAAKKTLEALEKALISPYTNMRL